ncbi:hypothetical protein ABH995_000870 [Bradyrhizobium yuanmingense]|uniref:hypothetical protein n=1 Tax=Bradyrhizobium yuanmingense TaxID=108015 RepID=UPI0035119125
MVDFVEVSRIEAAYIDRMAKRAKQKTAPQERPDPQTDAWKIAGIESSEVKRRFAGDCKAVIGANGLNCVVIASCRPKEA